MSERDDGDMSAQAELDRAVSMMHERNQRAYEEHHRNDLELTRHGEFALMHDGNLEMVLASAEDALTVGVRLFDRGKFTIIEIGAEPARLGAIAFVLS